MFAYLPRSVTSLFLLFVSFCLLPISMLIAAESPYLQAVHVLDPGIQKFKYYSSWNSDQWIEWVRNRYIEDQDRRRNNEKLEDFDPSPLYGQWVNIILIASEDEINSAFSEYSNRTYVDDESRSDFYWSEFPFPVYVVVRKPTRNENGETQSQYIVHNCSGKKMYINAKVDSVSFNPVMIQTFFPKQVKNPKDNLKIPLVVCTKVSQVRGLLDEIKFQLGS